ncbi:hypothetical protein Tco_0271407 [Tanacetum coccineum]
MICCGQFATKNVKRLGILTDEVLDVVSAPTYCRALDVITLRELTGPNGRLIAEDPAPEVPRVAMPRSPHPTITDLYDKIGRMETRQGTLERMARRQSYQPDRYAGVFEYMAGQYNVPVQGSYAPPGYDEEQQDGEEYSFASFVASVHNLHEPEPYMEAVCDPLWQGAKFEELTAFNQTHTWDLVRMENPNITMEEYIRLQEEKALSRGETFNLQTAMYGKMEYYEDEDHCFTNFETKFPAIVLDNTLTSDAKISCGPTVSPLNDNEIDFRISFDESDDEGKFTW